MSTKEMIRVECERIALLATKTSDPYVLLDALGLMAIFMQSPEYLRAYYAEKLATLEATPSSKNPQEERGVIDLISAYRTILEAL